ncbi:cryptochrome DASH [Acrasis kona]|uniref:Cryptochrome DASH n=1 Tax=Acrasis kona TaxID=1008807 RepID=A0AAW2YWT5_9EUKA
MTTPPSVTILWFRNDLRIHDNEALSRAIQFSEKNKSKLLPLYVFDDRQFTTSRVGNFIRSGPIRTKFLIESVEDLRNNFKKIGSNLMIKQGRPETIIGNLKSQVDIKGIFAQQEVGSEELNVDRAVKKKTPHFELVWMHTLLHPQDLHNVDPDNVPGIFTSFRRKVETNFQVRPPIDSPTDLSNTSLQNLGEEFWGQLPSVQDLIHEEEQRVDTRKVLDCKGGETEALKRVDSYIWKSNALGTYKETRDIMIGENSSSKFSPWLSLGCISPRLLYKQIKEYEKKVKANESTYWMVFELLWRDYFRFWGSNIGDNMFKVSGVRKYNNKYEKPTWSRNESDLKTWIRGETGYPVVDANMREIALTGWMSNRGRQIVASFLAKIMKMDWRLGAEYFESQLIDYDVTSNWCNWMYQAGVGNDPRDRVFNPIKQARDYDPHGEYIKKWLPELKNVPEDCIACPWKMSEQQQRASHCVIGDDYPKPIAFVPEPNKMAKRKPPKSK